MTGVTDIPLAAAVPVAVPLANAAPGGPQGPAGPTGPQGPPGAVEVFEQPGTPTEPVPSGALWIDTDAVPTPSPPAPDGTMLGVTVKATGAQMIALPSTPVLLVAGVAGKVIVPVMLAVVIVKGSVAWSGFDVWNLAYRNDPGNSFLSGGGAGPPFAFMNFPPGGIFSSVSTIAGSDLVIKDNGGSLSAGNGYFDFALSYFLMGTT